MHRNIVLPVALRKQNYNLKSMAKSNQFLNYRSCFIALAPLVPCLHISILWCQHRRHIRVSENDFRAVIHLTRPANSRSVDDGLLPSLYLSFFVKNI